MRDRGRRGARIGAGCEACQPDEGDGARDQRRDAHVLVNGSREGRPGGKGGGGVVA